MNNRKEILYNNFGRAAFVVLFFFLIYICSDKSVKHDHDPIQNNVISLVQSKSVQAIIVEQVQLPSYQTSWVSLPDSPNSKHFDTNIKISFENRNVSQKYILLQKAQLKIKPLVNKRIHYPFLSGNTEEPPFLS